MLHQMCVDVVVKRLNHFLFWIKPSSDVEYQRLLQITQDFSGSPIPHLDRWTEILGPSIRPCWIRMEGVCLHAWSEKVFQAIEECFGRVVQVDDDVKLKRKVDVDRVQVLLDSKTKTPRSIDLEVEGDRFGVGLTSIENFEECGRGLLLDHQRFERIPSRTDARVSGSNPLPVIDRRMNLLPQMGFLVDKEVDDGIWLPNLRRPVSIRPKKERVGTDLDFP